MSVSTRRRPAAQLEPVRQRAKRRIRRPEREPVNYIRIPAGRWRPA
jgi:hypothetical protein